jgi:two-component system CheB/CheR fusion protein
MIRKNEIPSDTLKFPVVGIGSSAGGLEALTELLTFLPSKSGMSFVIIQHLDPTHESLTAVILDKVTTMPVQEAKEGDRLKPNHVYIIPPNFSMQLIKGALRLQPRDENRAHHMVIDFFFQSLAQEMKSLAIGVVLSGTASDGTQGLISIKAEGGFVCVQEPKSAKYDGMPRSAIDSGIVDLILPPKGLALQMARIAKHPHLKRGALDESLRKIFSLLQTQMNVDFTQYKDSTIYRRIERRIIVNKMENIISYAKYLSSNPEEVKALYNDILINVTGFFRDPEVFKELKNKIFPKIVSGRPSGQKIRIWVPGCSTGEEVYSLAIALLEFLEEAKLKFPIQIFATDISDQIIQKARLGFYSEASTRVLSKKRLNLYFDKKDGGHKIGKMIRDQCLFSRHDVSSDPPFSKLDLVSCRNLLIYFSPILQKRIIPIFHYSLNDHGFLLLGRSEGISGFSNLFSQENKTNRIYSKINSKINFTAPTNIYFPPIHKQPTTEELQSYLNEKSKVLTQNKVDFEIEADQIILAKFAPVGAVINNQMEVLQFRGRIGPFIDHAPGKPNFNILKMIRNELLNGLRMTIQSSMKLNATAQLENLKFHHEGKEKTINIQVMPTNPKTPPETRKYLIVFEEVSSIQAIDLDTKIDDVKLSKINVSQLEQELHSLKEYQEALTEEYETSQEQLTSANEELQSTNEEFQSNNEELETAKEEFQSANEELTTVNDELQNRNLELTYLNNDLTNLLGAVEIPIIMVDKGHRIRRFTPKAVKALNLIPSDIGRPLGDIKSNFNLDLDSLVSEVIDTLSLKEVEVQDREGRWSRLQIRAYKTIDHKIDGAVIALMDIDQLKQSFKAVEAAHLEGEKANRTKDLFLATLSHELRTPLTGILAWAQMIQRGRLEGEKTKMAAERIVESGKAQAQLINDLLDVSRIIMGKIQLEISEVNPNEIIEKAVESIRPAANNKSIQLEYENVPHFGTVMADPIRMQQVFWNLLNNAIKFSALHSKVKVKLERIEDSDGIKAKALIKVIDSGKGINPNFLPHIFENFSQEDSSSIKIHGGLGLGLAIVKSLVEMQGGSVHAESEGEGQGSIFTVILPIKSVQNKSMSQNKKNSEVKVQAEIDWQKYHLEGLRILLVDDSANNRNVISQILISFGAEINVVNSAKKALEIFSQFKPDIIISDIEMPETDGYSLIKSIRQLEDQKGSPHIPAMALTAYANNVDINRSLAAGFQVHLAKPFDINYFVETISKLSGRSIGSSEL